MKPPNHAKIIGVYRGYDFPDYAIAPDSTIYSRRQNRYDWDSITPYFPSPGHKQVYVRLYHNDGHITVRVQRLLAFVNMRTP